MKKVTSLFLVLICCLSMSLPAFAAENTPSAEMLPYNGDAEISVFNQIGRASCRERVWSRV